MPTPPPVQPSTTQAPTEAQPPALAIRGLVKIFGNLVAVANLSLDIPKGSFYGFVGPNGAGKTTTLNMATGLLTPDQGTAYVNGIDVWKDDHPTACAYLTASQAQTSWCMLECFADWIEKLPASALTSFWTPWI